MIGKGIMWAFLGQVFNQGVGFVVSIFLARILMPEDFALIGMVMAFLGIANVFVDMGFGNALVQKKDVEDIHYNSIFWLNITLSLFVGSICFLLAPYAASYYGQADILNLMRVLSLSFFFNALGGVHNAMIVKEMDFKYLAKMRGIVAFFSGGLGIYCAYTGWGVWSLVIQSFSASIIAQFFLWRRTKWWPSFTFSKKAIKPLWDYSNKLFASGLLDAVFTRIDVFIIGKLFLPATLGFYSRGKSLNQLIGQYSAGSLNAVLFPALSKIQNDIRSIREKVKEFFHYACMASFLLGGGLYLLAEDLIVLMFTDKWLPTVPYFRIMVLTTFAYPLSAIVLTPLKSLGRTDIFLKLEVLKKAVLTVTYVFGFMYGLEGFLYALLVNHLIGISLNGYYTGKVINWKLGRQWLIILQYGLVAYGGGGVLFYFFDAYGSVNRWGHFLGIGTLFTVYFCLMAYLFKLDGFIRLISVLKQFKKRKSVRTNLDSNT